MTSRSASARAAPGRRLKRTVALVGLMGAGKSAVGRRLANGIGAPFRDSDDEIEAAAAMTIPEIFERFGEPYFREGERRVVARLLDEAPHVLATGGGAYVDPETRARLKSCAHTVWLKADLASLTARCARRDTQRPLLNGGDVEATLARLMAERDPIYAEADTIIETGDGPHAEAVSAVRAALIAAGVLA